MPKSPTMEEIVSEWLTAHGFDGLFNPDAGDCACLVGDLFPCDSPNENCKVGYKVPCNCGEKCGFHIQEEKPNGKQA